MISYDAAFSDEDGHQAQNLYGTISQVWPYLIVIIFNNNVPYCRQGQWWRHIQMWNVYLVFAHKQCDDQLYHPGWSNKKPLIIKWLFIRERGFCSVNHNVEENKKESSHNCVELYVRSVTVKISGRNSRMLWGCRMPPGKWGCSVFL